MEARALVFSSEGRLSTLLINLVAPRQLALAETPCGLTNTGLSGELFNIQSMPEMVVT
jgi:hypothetical protein